MPRKPCHAVMPRHSSPGPRFETRGHRHCALLIPALSCPALSCFTLPFGWLASEARGRRREAETEAETEVEMDRDRDMDKGRLAGWFGLVWLIWVGLGWL